jgi:hypothetical protein
MHAGDSRRPYYMDWRNQALEVYTFVIFTGQRMGVRIKAPYIFLT